jgi:hypothetical protein
LSDGKLLVKIPYLRWRIADKEWLNEPIHRKLWYKDILQNGDLLEIDNPREDEEIKLFVKYDGQKTEITKNQSGKFEIGRIIYTNGNKRDISVYLARETTKYDLFTIATKEHFVEPPISYRNGKVYWNVEDTFVGDKDNEFFLAIKSDKNNFRNKIANKNSEIANIYEDVCKIQVKIKDKNIFAKQESYTTIFEDKLIIGKKEQFRFHKKRIILSSANCFNKNMITFIPKYFIDDLQYVEEDENIYYKGKLCVIDTNGTTRVLNTMENERQIYDKTNPVRIELRNSSTLWLVAGYEGGNDFIGNLFCDIYRRGICNVAKEDTQYSEIILYKFKEEEYV